MRYLLSVFVFLFSIGVFGQEDTPINVVAPSDGSVSDDTPFMIVENMPALSQCKTMSGDERHQCTQIEIIKYVSKNCQYPPSVRSAGVQGTVFVYFVVGKDGFVKNAKVLRSVDPLLDYEAKRVVESLPRFSPGSQRGKNVSVQYTIPVKFSIRENTDKLGQEETDCYKNLNDLIKISDMPLYDIYEDGGSTTYEMNDNQANKVAQVDSILNVVYTEVHDIFDCLIKDGFCNEHQEAKSQLILSQRAWIKLRDAECLIARANACGGSIGNQYYLSEKMTLTKKRTQFLLGMIRTLNNLGEP